MQTLNPISSSYAQTKVRLPRFRAGLIERSALEARLGAALLTRRLVLLVAPAGYGKTAALVRQVSRLPSTCAGVWITVDAHDDLPRFLACLVDALEVYDPPWRVAPESLIERVSRQEEVHAVIDELVTVLAALPVEHGVIALDDMHLIAGPPVYEFVQQLLQRAPRHWTIAIATRAAPDLPLARLRAQHELAEFGALDLSFTREEIQLLWRNAGQDDSDATAQHLLDRTQGWVAGLCLTLDVARRSGTPAADRRLSQRHLFDYLASEVFESMSASWREFLMRCSVLSELSAARCAKVSGNAEAAFMLEEIEQRGIFVSVLDGSDVTLRLHDLFREFLEDRLRREHPHEIPDLLRRAAEDEPDTLRRADMLLRAGAHREAEDLVFDVAPALLAQGEGAQLAQLMERFAPGVRAASPRLLYARGLQAWSDFHTDAAKYMEGAVAGFEREGDALHRRRALAHLALSSIFWGLTRPGQLGEVIATLNEQEDEPDLETALAIESRRHAVAIIRGPQSEVRRHLSRLTELLERTDSPALWFRFLPFVSLHFGTPGARPLVQRLVNAALAVAADGRHLPLQLQARSTEGWLLLWNGQVSEAWERLPQLQSDERWAGRPGQSRFGSWLLNLTTSSLRGERTAFQVDPSDRAFAEHLQRLELGVVGITGMIFDNADLVRLAVSKSEGKGPYWDPFLPLFEARLALHEDRNEDALALLRVSAKTSADIDRSGLNAMVRVCLAIAELRTGNGTAAWQAIEPLVVQVRDSAEVLGVLFCGPGRLAELAGSRWPSDVPGEGLAEVHRWARLSRSLREDKNPETDHGPAAVANGAAVDTPLTPRESEVLALIAAGDSNKGIARTLGLSPHTVKRHVARILERLDLTSRGEAAAWYRRHHLVPSAATR